MVRYSPFQLCRSVCLLILLAIIGRSGQSPKIHPTLEPENSVRRYLPESSWLLADLDGDREPDAVGASRLGKTKDGYLYQVQLQLSTDLQSISFVVLHDNSVGLKIVSHDIDGDDDIDLSVSDQLSQHVGIWLNDGKGRFVKSPPGRFSPPSNADLAFAPLEQHFVEQRTGVSERRRLANDLAATGYIQPVASESCKLSCRPAEQFVHFAIAPLDERPPPAALPI